MEILDLYNSKKELLKKKFVRENGEPQNGEYKLSVHIWIINSKGKILIQKRSQNVRSNKNKWAFTGGAVCVNETSLEAALRETKEELNVDIDSSKIDFLISFKREHDFVDVWIAEVDEESKNIKVDEVEVSEVRWVSLEELEELIRTSKFVPSINLYYDLFIKLLEKSYNIKKN